MAAQCPFCTGELDERARVCPNCSRDVGIPEALRVEHDELIRKRDRLRAELAELRARLSTRRGRLAAGKGTG